MIQLSRSKTYTLAGLAFLYLVIRFGFTQHLDALGTHASYIFEMLCVLITLILLGSKAVTVLNLCKSVVLGSIISLASGFAIHKTATLLNITVPFDLKGNEILVPLLLIAPLLEEAVFRLFLWEPLQNLTKQPVLALLITSALFSYSHLHALWFVPSEIHSFIIYQTAYTFALGLACGYFMYRYYSLSSSILIHFAFNLGFYISAQV